MSYQITDSYQDDFDSREPYPEDMDTPDEPWDDLECCPNCGRYGGTPVFIRVTEDSQTGYVDCFDGCTRCKPYA